MDSNEPNQHNATFNYFAKENITPTSEQVSILAQIDDKAERKLKLRWILAVSCLPLFGISTAFGLAPQAKVGNIATVTQVEEIALDNTQNTLANVAVQHFWNKEHIRRDDTLNNLLSRLNIHNQDAIDFIRKDVMANEIAASLKPGHTIEAQTDSDGNLIALAYQLDTDLFINVEQTSSGYSASKVLHKLENPW